MGRLSKYTPVRVLLPFGSGIVASITFIQGNLPLAYLAGSLVCLLFLTLHYHFGRSSYRYRTIPGFCGMAGLLFAGIASIQSIGYAGHDASRLNGYKESRLYICRIRSVPVARANSYSCVASIVCRADTIDRWIPMDSRIQIYFLKDTICRKLLPGDEILLAGIMEDIAGPLNPGAFNFRRFLNFQKIYGQAFIEQRNWTFLREGRHYDPQRLAAICRSKFLKTLEDYNIDGNDLALAAGLILGNKRMLDQETIREFSNAGAMHVLSVSGLHVGIMYVLASRVLFFFRRLRNGKKIQQLLIILLIWAYAFLTGLPPSVVRASLMFSLIAASNVINRSHEGINILAGAAFIQLWIDPYEITRIGFQLSYMAVLGIFAFYKPLNDWFASSRHFAASVWSILAVSIAAQVATFPLAGYYFHFLPVYFLATNLIVVPLAGIIIYMALTVLVFSTVGINSEWLGLPLKWSLELMRSAVSIIQSWPGSTIKPILFTESQVVLFYMAVIGIFIWLVLKNRKGALVLLSTLILILSISGINRLDRAERRQVVIYHVKGHTAIDLIEGDRSYFLCDSSLDTLDALVEKTAGSYRIQQGVKNIDKVVLRTDLKMVESACWINLPFIFFHGKTIMIINERWPWSNPEQRLRVDIALVTGSTGPGIEEISKSLDAGLYMIDTSIPGWRSIKLVEEAAHLGISCHNIYNDGGFLLTCD